MFSGEEIFEEWMHYFKSVAAVNSWNDGEKVLWLRAALKGKARAAFK